MPHHAVKREEAATTKLRVVFNASAAKQGCKALNDVADPGPDLLSDLAGLLLRFREYKYTFQADIKKAFFMMKAKREVRSYLRFVWENDDGQMQVWRLKRLPFGLNCVPFILNAVLQYHLRQQQQAAKTVTIREVMKLLEKHST